MSYKLTLEFETKEELIAYLGGSDQSEPLPPKISESAPAKNSRKKAEHTTPSAPAKAAFNRDAVLGTIIGTMQAIQALGVSGDVIASKVGAAYSAAKVQFKKLPELTDAELELLAPSIISSLEALKPAPAAAPVSFI
jgi:hypothetical protein